MGAGLPRSGWGILASPRFPARVLSQSRRKYNGTKSQTKFNGCKTMAFQNGSRPELGKNGSGGGGGSDGKSELNALIRLIVAYPATRGTIAVALGYFFNCNPLETLKWSPDAMITGLVLAMPVIVFDACTMIPNWEPKRVSKKIKLLIPRAVAERLHAVKESESSANGGIVDGNAASGQNLNVSEDLVEIEREVSVSADTNPLQQALYTAQMSSVLNNRGRALNPYSELFLLILVHVSEEMLYRGLLLSLVIRWVTENLYYAGVEENVALFGGLTLALPQVGAVTGATGVSLAFVALSLRRHLNPLRVLKQAEEKFKRGRDNENLSSQASPQKEENHRKINKSDNSEVLAALEKAQRGIVQHHRWTVALEASNELLHWATASASFLLTGNIIAPISGSIVSDIFYSYCQRRKLEKLQADIEAQHRASAARAEQTHELLKAVQEHRKEKLAKKQNNDS